MAFIIAETFMRQLKRLPQKEQGIVSRTVLDLEMDPTARTLSLHRVDGNGGWWSAYANGDLRIILKREGDGGMILCWTDHHDKAYLWASRHVLTEHPVTHVMQIVEIPEVTAEPPVPAPITEQEAHDAAASKKTLCDLVGVGRDDLLAFGVPEAWIERVMSAIDEDELLDIGEHHLPPDAAEAVLSIAVGERPEIPKHDDGEGEGDTWNPQSWWVVSKDDDLEAVLGSADWDTWCVYLHPSQRKIVRKNANGPMKVLGGAGTGKTVVAMHRAKYLLEKVFIAPSERLLFTTFTRNLCDDIEALLRTICSDVLMGRIDVRNLDAWALEYVRSLGIDVHPLMEDKDKTALMEEAMALVEGADAFKAAFFLRERSFVVLPNGIDSIGAYLKASRAGLGVRLSATQKRKVWQVLEAYRSILARQGMMDFDEISILAANEIKARGNVPYVSVIVDEAQDFSAPALRLVAALSGNTREAPRPNSLLIVGDAHQRIYGKKATLGKCGINVMGRSSKLKLNYRTTEKIRKRAVALLEGVSVDDLDGAADDNKGFRSLASPAQSCSLWSRRMARCASF